MNGGMELYLHMPFCVRKCAYCDFLSFPTDQETQNLYTRRLREDIDAMGKKYGDIPVDTIFIGGGTPSVPDSALIVGIMEHVRKAFHVAEGAEISMEANPGTVTREKLTDYRRAGIKRAKASRPDPYLGGIPGELPSGPGVWVHEHQYRPYVSVAGTDPRVLEGHLKAGHGPESGTYLGVQPDH